MIGEFESFPYVEAALNELPTFAFTIKGHRSFLVKLMSKVSRMADPWKILTVELQISWLWQMSELRACHVDGLRLGLGWVWIR